MRPETKILLEEYKKEFKSYKEFLDKNDWIDDVSPNDKGVLYSEKLNTELSIVSTILKSMVKFKEDVGEDLSLKVVKDFINQTVEIIKKHLAKIDAYKKNNPLNSEATSEDFNFQTKLFSSKTSSKVQLTKLNIDEEESSKKSADLFYGNAKAPLIMRDYLCEKIPEIRKKTDALNIDFSAAHINPATSNEMLINMKPKDIPEWDPMRHFFEQDKSTIQFWEEEKNKLKNGINIGGYHISGWLYWHINIFKMSFGAGENKKIQLPHFRDNEFFFDNMYEKTKKDGRKGLFMFGSRRFAKALKNDEKLYYYDGTIRNIGDSKIGDEIIGRDGKKTIITGVYPQGKLKLYKVTLADKREIICCDDHLWTVKTKSGKEEVLPLSNIRKRLSKTNPFKIPICKPIQYGEKDFLIDPYFVGYIIGDGGLIKNIDISFTPEDENELKNYLKPVIDKYNIKLKKIAEHRWSLKNKSNLYSVIKDLGLNKPSWDKNIPEIYFFGSYQQRMNLLRGLLDSDGCCYVGKSANGKFKSNISFTTTSIALKDDVIRLCHTLGITTSFHKRNRERKGNVCRTSYDVLLQTDLPVFRLKRKLNKIIKRLHGNPTYSSIINIEEWGEDYATCIRVDNEDSTFLTTNCVVTHNTAGMTSRLLHTMWTVREAKGTVIGFSEKPDLEELVRYSNIHIQNIHPALKITANSLTITDGIALGLKGKKVQDIYDIANLTIINLEGGVTKKSSQKTAGGTPDAFLIDEAGKGPCIPSWKAAMPSFAGGDNNKWRCVPLISGTSGEGTLSQDAEAMLKKPDRYSIMTMDWDMLEEFVDPDYVTWKRNNFGFFIPAQMSLEAPDKILQPFGKFLDLGINTKKLDLEKLDNLNIRVTDWKAGKDFFEEKRAKLQDDLNLLAGEVNSFPLDPEDCYVTSEKNKFPGLQAKKRKTFVEEHGIQGQKVWLFKNGDKVETQQTNDPIIIEYPYKGGNFDAPIVILDDPYDRDGNKPPLGLYCAGFDDVKQSTSSGDSVMSCTVFKRSYEGGEWANRIVAYYDSRPDNKKDYYRNLYLLLKFYNARLLHENEDNGFVEYMEDNHMDEIHNHLSDGVGLATEESLHRNKNRKYGWSPTSLNIYRLEETMVIYTKEEGVKIGSEEDLTGIDRINHPMLLEEMYKYKKDRNADRLRSFGLALKLAKYYDNTYQYMKFRKKQYGEEETPFKKKKKTEVKGFTYTNKLTKF